MFAQHKLNTLRYTILLTCCSLKRKMHKSQQLKVYTTARERADDTIYMQDYAFASWPAQKNIHALGDSFYISQYEKNGNHSRKENAEH